MQRRAKAWGCYLSICRLQGLNLRDKEKGSHNCRDPEIRAVGSSFSSRRLSPCLGRRRGGARALPRCRGGGNFPRRRSWTKSRCYFKYTQTNSPGSFHFPIVTFQGAAATNTWGINPTRCRAPARPVPYGRGVTSPPPSLRSPRFSRGCLAVISIEPGEAEHLLCGSSC